MEDQDTCTTELFLRKDNGIDFGDTDGPLFLSAAGSWYVAPGTNDFTMFITRSYTTGSTTRDMGEFTYDLIRRYSGDMTMVGASVAITGLVFSKINEDGEEINGGYFNMIDATDERQGDDKKVPWIHLESIP